MDPHPATEPAFSDPPGRIALVLNPNALRNSKRPVQTERLLSEFDKLGETTLVGDGYVLTDRLRKWQADGLDLLAISGGDGTVQRVVDEVLSVWAGRPLPRILLLHGGTAGIVARESGHSDPLQAVQNLRMALQEDRPILTERLPILKVGHRHTLSFGLGVFQRLSEAYVTYGRQVALSHSWLGARVLTSYLTRGPFARKALAPCHCRIRIDGREYPAGCFVGLYACTIKRISGFHPLAEVDCPDGAFRIVGIRHSAANRIIRHVWQYLRGDEEQLSDVLLLCGTRSMTVEPENGIVQYMADGETYAEPGSLEICIGPELKVVRLPG